MSSAPKLTPFSFVVLVLVGDRGAGPHDLVQMMRDGRIHWTAPESQFYAEPKRLAEHGYLTAAKQPGRTHQRTHYTITEQGRQGLAEWLATPARFARIQNEPVVRLLGAEYAERGVLLKSLQALRHELDAIEAGLHASAARGADLSHRETVLRLNGRLAQRIVDAHRAWLDEVEHEL
jgi:PadR family transcriptional regulator, regulatory protein AphA